MNVMTPIIRDPSQQKFDTTDHLAHAAQQAEDRRYEDFMIIDVDSHHYETGSFKDILQYIEDPVLRDQFKYTKGQTLMLRSTGGFQEMANHRAVDALPVNGVDRFGQPGESGVAGSTEGQPSIEGRRPDPRGIGGFLDALTP